METWYKVPEYPPHYEANLEGRFRKVYIPKGRRNAVRYREISTRVSKEGYLTVRLTKNRRTHTLHVHRVLAMIFLANQKNKCCVNHKNGNKLDNRLENLEWVTHQENVRHAFETGLIKPGKRVKSVRDKCTGKRYESAKKAADGLKIPYSTVKGFLNGRRTNTTCLEYEE